MGNIHNSISIQVLSFLFLIFLLAQNAMGQERSRIRMNFQKKSSGEKLITATLYAGRGRDMVFLADQSITLTAYNADTSVVLTDLTTNGDGMAQLLIQEGYAFPLDEEGFTTIEASYEGNDDYSAASGDIEVKDIEFNIAFDEVDSVKRVSVKAFEKDAEGNEIPVDGLFMYIGVQRLYSILPIGEVMNSEDGVYSIEFPDDIPGDSTGKYTVVARIQDNEYYGNVEKKADITWGTPVSFQLERPHRRLWTDEAPLWMIISVFVILLGAWYHFFLSIYKLNKIKKVARE